MVTDPDDGDSEGTGSDATEPSEQASGTAASSEDDASPASESSRTVSGEAAASEGASDDESEWRFSLSDIEERQADGEGENPDGETDEEEEGGLVDAGVAGSMDIDEELEAGDIDLENALFVVFGVVLSLVVIAGFLNLWP